MTEIEITEDQHEYLEALREDIQQDVVGKYAHVRMVDAVQYLIDNHEGEINATVTAPSSGPDVSAANAPAADPVAPTDDGEEVDADETDDETDAADETEEETDTDATEEDIEEDDADDPEGEDDAAAEDANDESEDETETDDSADDDAADDADSGGATGSPPMAAAGGGGDDGMLSAMMALMDTHDDKWEAASGDTGYEVELPDGSTESANTQDDVRALLFKHYE